MLGLEGEGTDSGEKRWKPQRHSSEIREYGDKERGSSAANTPPAVAAKAAVVAAAKTHAPNLLTSSGGGGGRRIDEVEEEADAGSVVDAKLFSSALERLVMTVQALSSWMLRRKRAPCSHGLPG